MRDSFENTVILGGIGSGKTSGSGRKILKSFLRAGYAGLILTAKQEEIPQVIQYAKETNRLQDLMIFGPDDPWKLDVIEYEWGRPGPGGRQKENIVALIENWQALTDRSDGKGGDGEGKFWDRSMRQMVRKTVGLVAAAQGTVTIRDLYRVVVSAPQDLNQLHDKAWRADSPCWKCLKAGHERYIRGEMPPDDAADWENVEDYWICEFCTLSEKTRSIICVSFTSMIDGFNDGLLRKLFCSGTNLTPEDIDLGRKIVVMGTPELEYHSVGLYANVTMKRIFQSYVTRRQSKAPLFMFMDEAQIFLVPEWDRKFLSESRSYRCASVLLSQNVNQFYTVLGGERKGKSEVDALLGCCQTKIFHANSDHVTNDWAAHTIGDSMQYLPQPSMPQYGLPYWMDPNRRIQGQQGNLSMHAQYLPEVRASDFTRLRKGGPMNDFLVEGILFCGGRQFETTGTTWMPVLFNQQEE